MSSAGNQLSVWVNGSAMHLPRGATVADVIESLAQDPRAVAVESSGRIVPRAEYRTTVLEAGARLEIVRFVQGG